MVMEEGGMGDERDIVYLEKENKQFSVSFAQPSRLARINVR